MKKIHLKGAKCPHVTSKRWASKQISASSNTERVTCKFCQKLAKKL